MKIVHLIFDLNIGGAETMLVDIVNEQVKTENVSLIVVNKQVNEKLLNQIDHRVRVILIGRKEKSLTPLPIISLNISLLKIKPDVIHCHNNSLIRIILKKQKCVLTVHDMNIPGKYFKYYSKVFAISNSVKNDIEKRTSIIPILIYNGIKIDSIEKKKDYNFDVFNIVQVSSLNHNKKGQHILLNAINILVNEEGIKNIKLDFIGEGKSLTFLKKLVNDYSLHNYVNFLGLKDRNYIYEYLKDYNLLVQPSLYEGFGLSIVEAMAAKVPVLISDSEGPIEISQNGKYGWVFKCSDKNDLTMSILSIINSYNDKSTMSKINMAYNHSIQNFSVEETSKKYINNYKN